MKKKRILPLLMAAVLMAASIPVTVGATDASQDETQEIPQQTEGEEPDVTEGTPAVEDGASVDESGSEAVPAVTADTTEESQTEEDVEKANQEESEKEVESDNVVTLGENLSEEQRAAMYSYFGVDPDEVRTIIVTHADEVKYMEGIATAEQIGATTNSCAYV